MEWLVEYTEVDVNSNSVLKRITLLKNEVGHSCIPLIAACDQNHVELVKYLENTTRVDINLVGLRGNQKFRFDFG